MTAIRSFVYVVGQITSAILIDVLVLVTVPFPRPFRDRVISSWARFNIWTLELICGLKFRVKGLENIPDRPAIIISNHQSAWETLCFQLFSRHFHLF